MSRNSSTANRHVLSPTSKMSFGVAACAFAAAGIGLSIYHWMSGWMAVGGVAVVGLFYVAIGLLNLGSTSSTHVDKSDLIETSSHRRGAANVNDRAVEQVRDVKNDARNENLTNSRR